ncbi:MAG: leucine-rich repeat domain-containing protein [Clostridia bacterium]|nr:leucine-rich repeat domain-containing protein [Clostridia bacterium]
MALYGEYYVFESDRIKIIKGESSYYADKILTENLVRSICREIGARGGIPLDLMLYEQMLTNSFFIEICDDVTGIQDDTFRDCDDISKIRIANLKNNYKSFTIGEYAFAGSNLKTLEVDDISRKLYISKGAFACCKSLTKVELLSSYVIRSGAFSHCESLKTIRLPQNLVHLGGAVFDECKSLESIYIPKSYFDCWRIEHSVRGTNAQIILYDIFNEYDEDGHVLNSITSIPEKQNIEVSEQLSIIIPETANKTSKSSLKSFSGVIRPNLIANKKKNKL